MSQLKDISDSEGTMPKLDGVVMPQLVVVILELQLSLWVAMP